MPLGSGVRRALGRVLIQGLVPQGLGANAIIRALQRGGVSYRRKDMLDDIRLFSGKMKYEDAVRATGPGERVPTRYMVETSFKRPHKYRVYMDVEFEHPITGETYTQEKSFYTDEYLDVDEWESRGVERIKKQSPKMSEYVLGGKVKSVEHNEMMGY